MTDYKPESEPQFILDDDIPASVRGYAAGLEAAIRERPTEYLVLLAGLGSRAVAGHQEGDTPMEGDQVAMINRFFSENGDLYIGFDPDSESSLKAHNHYLALMADRRRNSSSADEREEVRQSIRFFRLEHFIGRVIAWQETAPDAAGPQGQAAEADDESVIPYPTKAADDDGLRTAS